MSAYPGPPGHPIASGQVHGHVQEEFQEIKTITLEWKISNLKLLFDSSRGEVKSRCIKSPPFGDGKWEIYFYGNSGADYVSLYLSAEPTMEERERSQKLASQKPTNATPISKSPSNPSLSSQSGVKVVTNSTTNTQPWSRDGAYRFVFEIRPVGTKPAPIKTMEAADHVFSSEARNWGWQSFARRADVYYNNPTSKVFDAFVVACTITYTPSSPTPAPLPAIHKKLVPLELLDAFAGMFDDPLYSDVKFVIRSRSSNSGRKKERALYAIRKILNARAEYFEMMFSSGFSEGKALTSSDRPGNATRKSSNETAFFDEDEDMAEDSDMSSLESDDEMMLYESSSEDAEGDQVAAGVHEQPAGLPQQEEDDKLISGEDSDEEEEDEEEEGEQGYTARTSIVTHEEEEHSARYPHPSLAGDEDDAGMPVDDEDSQESQSQRPAALGVDRSRRVPLQSLQAGTSTMRSVSTVFQDRSGTLAPKPLTRNRSALSGTSTASGSGANLGASVAKSPKKKTKQDNEKAGNGRKYIEIIVKDAAYSTYKALLYFLYTDTIVFAPLSSTYHHAKDTAELRGESFKYNSRRAFFAHHPSHGSSRTPQAPLPSPDLECSAKAIYKLADKLNIPELKTRAFQHIVQSLTVETIPYEAFSAFSNQFGEIRKVQVDMMLSHWNEVKSGQALKNIFKLVRQDPDRFPGYDEVMPSLLSCLEFRTPSVADNIVSGLTEQQRQAGAASS